MVEAATHEHREQPSLSERVFQPFLRHCAPDDLEGLWRTKLLLEVMISGQLTSLALTVGFIVLGAPFNALICALTFVVLAFSLVVLRITGRPTLVTHLCLASTLVLFLSPVFEVTLDGSGLAWLVLVPYVAVLLLGRGPALWWAAVTAVLLVLVATGRRYELIPLVPGIGGPGVMLVRLVGLTAMLFVFGYRFTRERQATVFELQRVSRAKSAFLANISHEIRTPMNGVLGLTELLLHGTLSADQREQVQLIQRSGQAMVFLINDLLDMSKIEAGALTVEAGDFNLDTLLTDLQRLAEPIAKEKDLVVQVERANDVPALLRGDALRLRQVLLNLLNNALKFTMTGSVRLLVIAQSHAPICLTFAVHDTGIGIAPDVLPRLFTPFQQADGSTTRRFGGTGLGLALSKELVQRMGGKLAATSAVGLGSTFSFSLPFEPALTSVALETTSTTVTRAVTQRPVLVVDDNPINLKVAVSLLQRAGYRTQTATNGAEAVQLVQAHHFHAVLMDCHMPVMDGFEATEKIRALAGAVARTPIIALTASVMPEELAHCKRSGMNASLTKPVSLQQLSATLATVEVAAGAFACHGHMYSSQGVPRGWPV